MMDAKKIQPARVLLVVGTDKKDSHSSACHMNSQFSITKPQRRWERDQLLCYDTRHGIPPVWCIWGSQVKEHARGKKR